jgi:3-phenylpropionate/cinnamic acid dioxygenase small subunit
VPEQGPGAERAPLTRAEAEAFLYREARLMDERQFEDWLALFDAECRYLVPGDPGDGGGPAIVDDDRPTLEDRIARLRSPATHAQSPPSRTLHVVANVEVEPARAEGEARVHSTGVICETRLGATRWLAARCLHVLRRAADGSWRIALKRVQLLDGDRPHDNLTFLL